MLQRTICVIDIVEILNKLDCPLHDATPFAFITTIRNQDLFAQVAHPPKGTNADTISPEDYEVKDIMLEGLHETHLDK